MTDIILIVIAVIIVIAIWNLVISIQNMRNEKKYNNFKEKIKETNKEMEKKRDYYGRFK